MTPQIIPAPDDLWCWLYAAFPLRANDTLDVSRIAATLDISSTTVCRWIKRRSAPLSDSQWKTIHRRAILRGRGHYRWPPPDPHALKRNTVALRYALTAMQRVKTERRETLPPAWIEQQWLAPYVVSVRYYHPAKVYGIHIGRTSAVAPNDGGEVVSELRVANRHVAVAVKLTALETLRSWHCISPSHLVPTGRTETWRDVAPSVDLQALARSITRTSSKGRRHA